MKAIIFTGTPGSGKTFEAKKYAVNNNLEYIDVKKVISEHNLCESKDEQRDCIVVDETKLAKILVDIIKKSSKQLVIDSHMSHFISPEYVEICYVCKCEFKELEKRLQKRGYSKDKIKENIECEIMDVCLNESKEAKHNVEIINT